MNFIRKHFKPSPDCGYVFEDSTIELAINCALAARRPLLVEGPPGAGKSSLARAVAKSLKWRYYQAVVTSRTQAQDLLYQFDTVRRLNDSTVGKGREMVEYVEPGALWWAMNRDSARRRGAPAGTQVASPAEPKQEFDSAGAVVLLDEIDKADPDVPNDLLVPIDGGGFTVHETAARIEPAEDAQWLLVMTTNKDRDLSPAFLRRCVLLSLETPAPERLAKIAELHLGPDQLKLFGPVAGWLKTAADAAKKRKDRQPSTAEYLDAIRACRDLEIHPEAKDPDKKKAWEALSDAIAARPKDAAS